MAIEIIGASEGSREEHYVKPTDGEVLKRLEWWQDQKLGIFPCLTPSAQLGIMESWPLCYDDWWCKWEASWTDDMDEFDRQYWDCNKTFNPVKFRPDKWAAFAASCGFKYVAFTTKHVDGFCMYDTKTTDYRITSADCPFHTHKYADIVGNLFKAFRAKGLGVAAYFSKPDWHSQDYWSDDFPKAMTRNPNYKIKEHPEKWERFVQMTHEQLREITSKYGKIDVLWLDGGWVTRGMRGPGHQAGRDRRRDPPHHPERDDRRGPGLRRPLRKLSDAGADRTQKTHQGSLGIQLHPGGRLEFQVRR